MFYNRKKYLAVERTTRRSDTVQNAGLKCELHSLRAVSVVQDATVIHNAGWSKGWPWQLSFSVSDSHRRENNLNNSVDNVGAKRCVLCCRQVTPDNLRKLDCIHPPVTPLLDSRLQQPRLSQLGHTDSWFLTLR